MNLTSESIGKLYAAGRNYANYGMGFLTALGLSTAAENKDLMAAFDQIYNGVVQVVTGATNAWQILVAVFGPIITVVLAKFASNSASSQARIKAVEQIAKDTTQKGEIKQSAAVTLLNAASEVPGTEKIVNPLLSSHEATSEKVVSK